MLIRWLVKKAEDAEAIEAGKEPRDKDKHPFAEVPEGLKEL